MDASTQVAPMPVLHSVMMLKVSEASRATSVTRAAAAAAAATSRRNSLSLQHALLHVQAADSTAATAATAPMTPHAAAPSKPATSASSPRDPSSKVAAASPPLFAAKQHGFAVSPLKLHPTIQTHAAATAAATPSSPASSSCSESVPSSPVGKRNRDGAAAGVTVTNPTPGSSSPKSSSSSPKATKANTGRWTDAEHKLFLKGLETFPYRAWKKIATLIKTRTVVQIRTHAQKYYQKLEKEEARMKDREHQLAHQHGFSKDAASSASAVSHAVDAGEFSDMSSPKSSSPAKKKSLLRKRKFTLDDDALSMSSGADSGVETLPSLPKRMMKEKKFPREKHMSPKQKAPVSGNKFFGASFGSPEFGAASALPESAHRAVFGGRAAACKIPPHPLEFDDDAASEGMILDFADDKSIVEYPFHLDGGMDQSISSMDNDDLLQLTDEESLDWFSTASSEQEDGGESAEELLKAAAAAAEPMDLAVADADAAALESLESSPLTLGRYHFSPLYTDECLQFSDASSSSSVPSSSTAMLGACDAEDFLLPGGDDDDDFVLDPEKFLSSYFSPSASEH